MKGRLWLTSYPSQLSLSSIFMLYAVSIVYMDVLRLPLNVASARHAGHIESALKSLEHYDHPAATLAEASPLALFPPKRAGGLTFLICIWKNRFALSRPCVGTCWSTLSTNRRALTIIKRFKGWRCESRTLK